MSSLLTGVSITYSRWYPNSF